MRSTFEELQGLIDPLYEKYADGTESGELAFGIELGKLLERVGWTKAEFMQTLMGEIDEKPDQAR